MKKSVAVVGGGSSALLAAAFLDEKKFRVTIYEKNKTLGRKFLVAGKGGFNLTHSEPINKMIDRYTPNEFLKKALLNFDNQDVRNWFNSLGIPTFIGSSKRVYPEQGIKPIVVLNAITDHLNKKGVEICFEHHWKGWDNKKHLLFNTNTIIKADFVIFALGGGSWKVTGSDGDWLTLFENQKVQTLPFLPSNCRYAVEWSEEFIAKHEGCPLKNIAISCSNQTQKGEVVLTRFGLEGNAIYALSPQIREELQAKQKATVYLDLKPSLSTLEIYKKLNQMPVKSISDTLRSKLKFSDAHLSLIKTIIPKENFLNVEFLTARVKALPITITGTSILDEAISTVGGISLDAIDDHFQMKGLPEHYCIGEMLDYDAPTGGYLLQSCFSTGVFVATHLNENY